MEVKLTKDNYAQVVEQAEKPVLIDFFATWCGPCMMLAPFVEKLSNERDDIVVCKVNVDEEEELAVKFGVNVIPTLALVKDGKVAKKAQGYMEYADLDAFARG